MPTYISGCNCFMLHVQEKNRAPFSGKLSKDFLAAQKRANLYVRTPRTLSKIKLFKNKYTTEKEGKYCAFSFGPSNDEKYCTCSNKSLI